MTAPELAEMVRIMRRDQLHWHQTMTSAARIKVEHSERAVDRAVSQILGDEPTDGISGFDKAIPAPKTPAWAWQSQ